MLDVVILITRDPQGLIEKISNPDPEERKLSEISRALRRSGGDVPVYTKLSPFGRAGIHENARLATLTAPEGTRYLGYGEPVRVG